MRPIVLLCLLISANCGYVSAQIKAAYGTYKWHVGLVLDDDFGTRFLTRGKRLLSVQFPRTIVAKYYFHPSNSVNFRFGTGTIDAISNNRYLLADDYLLQSGYEYTFFAGRRLNLLTGLNFGYVYNREVVQSNNFYRFHPADSTKWKYHAELGTGINIGSRLNVGKRTSLETHIADLYMWPAYRSYSNKRTFLNQDGWFNITRFFSIELYYHFSK